MRKIRVGVVSTGRIADFVHLPSLRICAEWCDDVTAVASRDTLENFELRWTSAACGRQKASVRTYQLLAPIYGSFTEGFNSSDLQGARALLEELRRDTG